MVDRLRLWPPSAQRPSEQSAELSNSSSDSYGEQHPLYPHRHYIGWLYNEMLEEGFYDPHVSVSFRSARKNEAGPTKLHRSF